MNHELIEDPFELKNGILANVCDLETGEEKTLIYWSITDTFEMAVLEHKVVGNIKDSSL